MNPTISERQPGVVLGTMTRIDPTDAKYDELWTEYMSHDAIVKRLAVDATYYGVYYGTGIEGRADFVAGMMVPESVRAPEGLTLRPVPGGTYAAFECTMATIGQTWRDIYSNWLPTSGYVEDEARPSFEHYPTADEGPDAAVMIYLPVRKA